MERKLLKVEPSDAFVGTLREAWLERNSHRDLALGARGIISLTGTLLSGGTVLDGASVKIEAVTVEARGQARIGVISDQTQLTVGKLWTTADGPHRLANIRFTVVANPFSKDPQIKLTTTEDYQVTALGELEEREREH